MMALQPQTQISVSMRTPVNSELLCFVTDKGKSMAFDHLVKLVTDFYSEDELMAAKSLLDNYTGTLCIITTVVTQWHLMLTLGTSW